MSTFDKPQPTWHVLVLLDPNEGDMLGIWGPYTSLAEAEIARDELEGWPIAPGTWEVIRVKNFPATVPAPSGYRMPITYTNTESGGTVTWTNNAGDVFTQ